MDSEVYKAFSKYKQNGEYPADVSSRDQKKAFRRMTTTYTIKDGLLFYVRKGEHLQVIREVDKDQVLKGAHDDPTSGGHFTWEKTWGKLKDKYYWKGMSSHIKEWCRSCDTCQRHNKQGKLVPQELHPIPVPSEVMCQVGIDFVGPMRTTASGNNALLVMTDYKSKWPEVEACPDMSAVTVAKFIYKMICRHGTFRVMISDRGRAFVNELNDWLCEKMNMRHQLCSPYHPQSNGQTKRFNGTLVNSIVKVMNDEDDWDQYVDGVQFAYRTSIHASTKVTPFQLMYGRTAVLPFQWDITPNNLQSVEN